MRRNLSISALMLLIVTGFSYAEISLPALIGDNMVLQQGQDARIWGWAEPGEKVSISFHSMKQKRECVADESGHWSVNIPTPKVGGPYEMEIAGSNTITIKNILVGEVWICSGQSNMEMPLTAHNWGLGVYDYEKEIQNANYPEIRLFSVKRAIATQPQEDVTGTWLPCSPKTVPWFSATAYFFGRELYQELGIPIGLIHSSWGGTPAEAWTSREKLHELGDFENALNIEWLELNEENKGKAKQLANKREKVRFAMEATNLGYPKGYADPDFDDSDWPTMEIPRNWENSGIDKLKDFDGVVWFRKTIEIPAEVLGPDAELRIGKIDDCDTTYINGIRLGGISYGTPSYWMADRTYFVPGGFLRPGKNTIAIRVFDDGGAGGLTEDSKNMWLGSKNDPEVRAPLAGPWKYKVEQDFTALKTRLPDQNTPTMLYNAMIAPVVPYRLRGAIWYQGESNHGNGYGYRKLFPAMIADWRERWQSGDFPFYFVQIAPFYYNIPDAAAELREAQLMTLSTPNTGMIVTTDISTPDDIHPRNKQDVGKRLALWALSKTYDKLEKDQCSGPLFKAIRTEGNKIRVFFDYTKGGLVAKNGPLRDFEIAGKDRVFYPAQATIDKNSVVVSSPKVKKPVAVRMGWSNAPKLNLFNGLDLPASPFRSDDWPGVSCPGTGPIPTRGNPGPATVAIHVDQIVNDNYLGLGVQWSAYPWWEISEQDWQKIFNRLDYMKMSLSRVIVMAFYYTMEFDDNGEPVYDWNTPVMKRYEKLLGWCQENNCKVMFGEWNCPKGGKLKLEVTDPKWTRLAVDCTQHLLDKGYTCITWYNLINEPYGYWTGVTREDWIVAIKNLFAELKKQDLYPTVTIAAPDADRHWTHLQLEDPKLRELTGIYDEHWYVWNKDILAGNLERWTREQEAAIQKQDPGKGYILGELGLLDGKTQDDKQPNVWNFWYGVSMADAAIQTIRGGMDGAIAWDLDDAMHYFGDGDIPKSLDDEHPQNVKNQFKVWGFWNILGEEFFNKPEEEYMRPWFYSWSVLTRNFPPGSQILNVDPTGRDGVRVTAAIIAGENGKNLTIAAVNNSEKSHDLLIHVPDMNGTATFACFEYFDTDNDNRVDAWPMTVDENGKDIFPSPTRMIQDMKLKTGIPVILPPKSFVLLTTLEGGKLTLN